MNRRRFVSRALAWALVFYLFTGVAYAIYQKAITLTGSVTLVYVAPTPSDLTADDYIKMARDSRAGCVAKADEVRTLATNTMQPITWGSRSLGEAYDTIRNFFSNNWQKQYLRDDSVFMAQYNAAYAQIEDWYNQATAFHSTMYTIANQMEDWSRTGNLLNQAESSYSQYLSAVQRGTNWGSHFDKLKASALACRAEYLEVLDEKAAVDAKLVEMAGKRDNAWELIKTINNFNPTAGAAMVSVAASPTPAPTPSPTVTPSPAPEATPTPVVEPTLAPTPEPAALPTPEPAALPTPEPAALPTLEPAALPAPGPTPTPALEPAALPTPEPAAPPAPEPTPNQASVNTEKADVQQTAEVQVETPQSSGEQASDAVNSKSVEQPAEAPQQAEAEELAEPAL